MNKNRCDWAKNKVYIEYHDEIWGNTLKDESKLFELLILETQATGLSFWQIFAKKDEYNKFFDLKNPINNTKMSLFDIQKILSESLLIKNKRKLLSIVNNSLAYLNLIKEYKSLSNFIWNNPLWLHEIGKTNDKTTIKSDTSDKMTKILKKFGFTFIGSITIFSFLQAIGFYKDHQKHCYLYKKNK